MLFARSTICVLFACAVALVIGCKSGVERDVVEREMRQQEDQIYALQDYLSEYQQLLCDARGENAQLKRQMVQGQFREEQTRDSSENSHSLPSPPATAPTPPPGTNTPGAAPAVVPPEVPPLDISPPGAPPVKDQTSNEPEQIVEEVLSASAEIEVVDKPPAAVVLRGEVQLDDQASGARILVDVEPVAADGKRTRFNGRLSLMVLDPAVREKDQQLARWDFQPNELEPLATRTKAGVSFEFPLQLPADAPSDRPLELWVRLIPEDGDKLLGRTMLDLSRACQFGSADLALEQPSRPSVEVASAEMPLERSPLGSGPKFDSDLHKTGWETAKPGDRAKLQAISKSQSEWKMATEPVPKAEPVRQAVSKAIPAARTGPRSNGRYGEDTGPEWSPERPDSQNAAPRAAWSPTR